MNNIISVIEGEAKYIQDSTEGHPQYRSGYLAELRAVSEFVIQQESESDTCKPRSRSTDRLFGFQSASRSLPWNETHPMSNALNNEEASTLESVLAILRTSGEDKDYLEWWLQTFAGPESHDPARCCPLFPDLPAPRNAVELDTLEAQIEPFLSGRTASSSGSS